MLLASRAGRREDPGKSVMPALASPSPAVQQLAIPNVMALSRLRRWAKWASTTPRSRLERSMYPIHEILEEANQSYLT